MLRQSKAKTSLLELYMDVKIAYENNHVVVRDSSGNFLFSADTWQEAMCELESEMILTA